MHFSPFPLKIMPHIIEDERQDKHRRTPPHRSPSIPAPTEVITKGAEGRLEYATRRSAAPTESSPRLHWRAASTAESGKPKRTPETYTEKPTGSVPKSLEKSRDSGVIRSGLPSAE